MPWLVSYGNWYAGYIILRCGARCGLWASKRPKNKWGLCGGSKHDFLLWNLLLCFCCCGSSCIFCLNLLGRPRFAWWTVCYDKQLDSVITTSTQWSTYKNSLTHTLPIISLGTIITVKEKIPAVTPEPIPWFDLVDRDSWALPELAAARVEKGSQSWLCS